MCFETAQYLIEHFGDNNNASSWYDWWVPRCYMYKSYNWNSLKRHSAHDVLKHLYVCTLCHIQDMQLVRFYSMTASQ